MAANRVQRLVLAGKAIRRTGVDQLVLRRAQVGRNLVKQHRAFLRRAHAEAGGVAFRRAGVQLAAGLLPRLDAAIEHRHRLVAQPAQQPPGAGGVHAASVVVGHHLAVGADAERAEADRQALPFRQRVTAVAAVLGAGQVVIQVQVVRAGQVALVVGGTAEIGVIEAETAVEQHGVAVAQLLQFAGGNQGSKHQRSSVSG
ncbi:hypothetical protein D3C85_1248890 [compost metagenome]